MDTGLADSGLPSSTFLSITSLKWLCGVEAPQLSFALWQVCALQSLYYRLQLSQQVQHRLSNAFLFLPTALREILSRQMASPNQNVQNESLKTSQSICLADTQELAVSCFLENSAPSGYLWVTRDHCKSCALLTLSTRLLSFMAFLMTDFSTGRADVSLWFGTWK